jgi:hypothetical protein
MPRIRTIKPELYMDEELGVLSGDHTVLFTGLWPICDREGRTEDRPARIKAAVFPYRAVDVEALLCDLEAIGKVVRYEADGIKCIWVPGFTKHQRPHPKEPPSALPAPPEEVLKVRAVACREKKRQETAGSTVIPSSPVGREGKGREGVSLREGDGEPAGRAAGPPPPAGHPPRLVHPPKSPPSAWTGMDFWAWAQHTRQQAKLAPEREPRIEALGGWWNGVRMLVGDVEAVKEAFFRFGEDEYWQKKRPPLPFAAFMQQWEKYLPRGAGGPHAAT